MRLFYNIVAHNNLEYLLDLIAFIYSTDDFYYISIDAKSPIDEAQLRATFRSFPNIFIEKNTPVVWYDYTIIDVTLSAIEVFVQLHDYDYFINITGSDFPLLANAQQKQLIDNASKSERKKSFIRFDPLPKMYHFYQPQEGYRPIQDTEYRVKISAPPAVLNHINEEGAFKLWNLRSSVYQCGSPYDNSLRYLPLCASEIEARRRFFKNKKLYLGRAWMVLSRAHAVLLQYSEQFASYILLFRTIQLPDESFFQTFLCNEAGTNELIPTNLRFFGGVPIAFDDTYFKALSESQYLFARKINIGRSPKLLQQAKTLFQDSIQTYKRQEHNNDYGQATFDKTSIYSNNETIERTAAATKLALGKMDYGFAFVSATIPACRFVSVNLEMGYPSRPFYAYDKNSFLGFIVSYKINGTAYRHCFNINLVDSANWRYKLDLLHPADVIVDHSLGLRKCYFLTAAMLSLDRLPPLSLVVGLQNTGSNTSMTIQEVLWY